MNDLAALRLCKGISHYVQKELRMRCSKRKPRRELAAWLDVQNGEPSR